MSLNVRKATILLMFNRGKVPKYEKNNLTIEIAKVML